MDIKKEVIRLEQEMVDFLNELKGKDLNFKIFLIIEVFKKQFKEFGFEEPPFEYKNLRENLELSIVYTEMAHCLYFKENLTIDARVKDLEWSPLYNYLAEIKVKHFGKEIFEENGLEIVDINENGFLVRDKNNRNIN